MLVVIPLKLIFVLILRKYFEYSMRILFYLRTFFYTDFRYQIIILGL